MKNLSISLSKDLIIDSDQVAKELGVTRTEFIRQAVIHELKNFKLWLYYSSNFFYRKQS